MLKLALSFELVRLFRSRTSALSLGAFVAAGVLAVALGQAHVAAWTDAVAAGTAAHAESVAEARALFDSGEKGPADQPWVDLGQPRWQDRYAGTRLARAPAPLAGIAAGSIDPAPAVFQIHVRADPLAAGGYRIENPELTAGAVDLVFVLGLLVPLLIGVLGLDIGGREREERIDRLVLVQAGSVARWLVARAVAVSTIVAGAAATVCLGASVVGGAAPVSAATLVALAVGYSLLWGGLLLAVSAGTTSVRSSAFRYGALWTVLCILLPAIAAEVGLGQVQADFAAAETLAARAATYDTYDQEVTDLQWAVFERFPELKDLPASAEEELSGQARRHVYDVVGLVAMVERHEDRLARETAARQLGEAAAWFSPPLALTLALERLSGVGPEAASAYRTALVRAVEARVGWVVRAAWQPDPLTSADFEALVTEPVPPHRWQPTRLTVPVVILSAWLLAAWLLAIVGLARAERRVGLR